MVKCEDTGQFIVVADRQGNRYIPSIVRVGLSVHHSVEAVSLDALVESRMRSAKASSCTVSGRLATYCQSICTAPLMTCRASVDPPDALLLSITCALAT